AYDELDKQRIPACEMGTDDTQRRGDGGTRHNGKQTDGENGIQQSLFHKKTRLNNSGDCSSTKLRKDFFAAAKVAFFLNIERHKRICLIK
ncbi:MAG: hypothetical protein K6E51_11420, partial [Treponema sp.]|nr:hypothetical protein [Treponema sp.]